jgi:hypothetical protein
VTMCWFVVLLDLSRVANWPLPIWRGLLSLDACKSQDFLMLGWCSSSTHDWVLTETIGRVGVLESLLSLMQGAAFWEAEDVSTLDSRWSSNHQLLWSLFDVYPHTCILRGCPACVLDWLVNPFWVLIINF